MPLQDTKPASHATPLICAPPRHQAWWPRRKIVHGLQPTLVLLHCLLWYDGAAARARGFCAAAGSPEFTFEHSQIKDKHVHTRYPPPTFVQKHGECGGARGCPPAGVFARSPSTQVRLAHPSCSAHPAHGRVPPHVPAQYRGPRALLGPHRGHLPVASQGERVGVQAQEGVAVATSPRRGLAFRADACQHVYPCRWWLLPAATSLLQHLTMMHDALHCHLSRILLVSLCPVFRMSCSGTRSWTPSSRPPTSSGSTARSSTCVSCSLRLPPPLAAAAAAPTAISPPLPPAPSAAAADHRELPGPPHRGGVRRTPCSHF